MEKDKKKTAIKEKKVSTTKAKTAKKKVPAAKATKAVKSQVKTKAAAVKKVIKTKTVAKKPAAKKTVAKKKTAAKKTAVAKSVAKKTPIAKKKDTRKSKVLLDVIVKCLDKNKAENIVVIDLDGKSSLADFMVVASGRSQKQVGALTELVSKEVKAKNNKITINIEGRSKSDWAVMDFGDIIVHIFHPEARDFYKIEEIWQD